MKSTSCCREKRSFTRKRLEIPSFSGHAVATVLSQTAKLPPAPFSIRGYSGILYPRHALTKPEVCDIKLCRHHLYHHLHNHCVKMRVSLVHSVNIKIVHQEVVYGKNRVNFCHHIT
ncbi:uncharacterized protein LOC127288411 [Leptopilina boulardi]|uniref:uncharacterized protein LOC127288411 n=1 Tax=Leptopilina boulardi TaxID=63433 RepID=UPI0021F5211A|nr:uncharacterized protein LOC127288411 [Leptopilina boulardi]